MLYDFMYRTEIFEVWSDARCSIDEQNWIWSSNENIAISSNITDIDCTAGDCASALPMQNTGLLRDRPCADSLKFICQHPSGSAAVL